MLNSFIAIVSVMAILLTAASYLAANGFIKTKVFFLAANRDVRFLPSAFSIAATWIWAPALFVSAQKAYQQGIVGLFWFTVPNVLCLILFSFFAERIRKQMPFGFTISDYMRASHSDRVQSTYWVTTVGLTVCAFAVQLLAGGKLISSITGISFFASTIILSAIPLAYSMVFGLRASIFTDYLKIFIILVLGLVAGSYALNGNVDTLIKGFGGISGQYTSLFSESGIDVFLTFGIPVTIGLISGPFGDQSFWQRAYATDVNCIKRSFITAAFVFAVVPLVMAIFGFLAAGSGFKAINPTMVNLEFISSTMPGWMAVLFVIIVFAGITSILDSKLCQLQLIFKR